MKHDSKEVELKLNLPDFSKDDVKVKLSKNSIVIKADKKYKSKVQKKDFFHSQKSHQRFYYTTTVPRINPKKAQIQFVGGVLKITAPRV